MSGIFLPLLMWLCLIMIPTHWDGGWWLGWHGGGQGGQGGKCGHQGVDTEEGYKC